VVANDRIRVGVVAELREKAGRAHGDREQEVRLEEVLVEAASAFDPASLLAAASSFVLSTDPPAVTDPASLLLAAASSFVVPPDPPVVADTASLLDAASSADPPPLSVGMPSYLSKITDRNRGGLSFPGREFFLLSVAIEITFETSLTTHNLFAYGGTLIQACLKTIVASPLIIELASAAMCSRSTVVYSPEAVAEFLNTVAFWYAQMRGRDFTRRIKGSSKVLSSEKVAFRPALAVKGSSTASQSKSVSVLPGSALQKPEDKSEEKVVGFEEQKSESKEEGKSEEKGGEKGEQEVGEEEEEEDEEAIADLPEGARFDDPAFEALLNIAAGHNIRYNLRSKR
jgi:hypothetical protein